HGDFRLDNMLFGLPPAPLGPAVIDWQLAVKGRGVADVAYFLSFSVSTEQRRALEPQLLRAYHEALLARGVKEYGFEECLEDYRLALLQSLIRLVTAGGVLDTSSRRGRALALALIRRVDAALADHRVVDLL